MSGAGQGSRRQQILDAAADLFARSGFRGVGIDEIGGAVGISGPALYRHFPRKEAILGDLLVGASAELLAGGRERVTKATDPRAGLESLVEWHVRFALDNPALITVQSRDLDSLGDDDRDRVRALQRDYVEVWAEALGALAPVDRSTARAAAHAAFGLINSTPHSARLDRAAMAELLQRMALGALAAAGVLAPVDSSEV